MTKSTIPELFETNHLAKLLRHSTFEQITLQVPDQHLHLSVLLIDYLKELTNSELSILADTSHGNCCVDYVASTHIQASLLVHFGHCCFSETDKIKVVHCFERKEIEDDIEVEEMESYYSTTINKRIIIIYDCEYEQLATNITQKLNNKSNKKLFDISKVFKTQNINEFKNDRINMSKKFERKFMRYIPKNSDSDASYLYIGNNKQYLTYLSLSIGNNSTTVNQYDPILKKFYHDKINKTQILMKRLHLVEKSKKETENPIIGIIINTCTIEKYKNMIESITKFMDKINTKYFSFVVGKINPYKLGNFLEIDVFVAIGCHEQTFIINNKDYHRPIVTPFELFYILNRHIDMEFEHKLDFDEIIKAYENTVIPKIHNNNDLKTEDSCCDSLLKKSGCNQIQKKFHSEAAIFLNNRSFVGLDSSSTPNTNDLIIGKSGIAQSYENEISSDN